MHAPSLDSGTLGHNGSSLQMPCGSSDHIHCAAGGQLKVYKSIHCQVRGFEIFKPASVTASKHHLTAPAPGREASCSGWRTGMPKSPSSRPRSWQGTHSCGQQAAPVSKTCANLAHVLGFALHANIWLTQLRLPAWSLQSTPPALPVPGQCSVCASGQ